MFKKSFYLVIFSVFLSTTSHALTTTTTCEMGQYYTSCNAGYYLNGASCVECPVGTFKSGAGTDTSCNACRDTGTTAATGATDINNCYLPTDTQFQDTTGNGKYVNNCHYTN